MSFYSIKDLEILTGIKAHTIRIWEQRYEILEPQRTKTNIRNYDDNDLRHLLNVSVLNRNGYKISKVAQMTNKEIESGVSKITSNSEDFETLVDSLILAMINFNGDNFEDLISSAVAKLGFEEAFLNIVFPFVFKIGVLWQTNSIRPAQEHFVSNLIRQKIIVAIDSQTLISTPNTKKIILYLPDKEMHELTLLFMNYLMRARNIHTIYLGASVPLEDLIITVSENKPHFVMSVFTAHPLEDQVINYLAKYEKGIKNIPLLLGGRQAMKNFNKLPKFVKLFKTFEESIAFISECTNEDVVSKKIDFQNFKN